MARKLRLEFPGAIYHVINRGNYRTWLFRQEGAKAAFEDCLLAACRRQGWLLHGFVVMGNHYHLAVETPKGNLVSGMQWLQSTFGNRFNRLRGERGHLFQGRYKSLLVEEGEPLGLLCDYIHLNPVRAGIVSVERLGEYRYSSYWYLQRPKSRPDCLRVETALEETGGLADTPVGRRSYGKYLAWQSAEGPAGRNGAYASLSCGWALGGEGFKKALLAEHDVAAETRAWESSGVRKVREARWQQALDRAAARLSAKVRQDARKSAPWKVAVAAHLKESTDVSNRWLADRLGMGSAFYVSKHVGLLHKPGHPAIRWLERIKR